VNITYLLYGAFAKTRVHTREIFSSEYIESVKRSAFSHVIILAAAGGVIAAADAGARFTLAHFISTSPPDNSISCSRVVNYYRSAPPSTSNLAPPVRQAERTRSLRYFYFMSWLIN